MTMKKMFLTLALILTFTLSHAAGNTDYAFAIDLDAVEVTAPALDMPMLVLNLDPVVVTAPAPDAVAMVIELDAVEVTASALDAAFVLNLDPVVVTASATDLESGMYAEALSSDLTDSLMMY